MKKCSNNNFLIIVIIFILHIFPTLNKGLIEAEHASFYGNSFISIPFEESKTSTDISFKFRTRLSDALILLVAGVTDYCKIDLDNGQIRVVLNLGSGETELTTHSQRNFNDFKWHEILIQRRDENLAMIVDKSIKIQEKILSKHYELDIHYGLFVGDHKNKNNSDLFFGHIKTFRGCLSELKYNNISVFEIARMRKSPQIIVEAITWNCAAEFEATLDQPISFVEDDGFLMIPQKLKFKDFNVKMEIKTIANNGLIFYNPGTAKPDFLLLELSNMTISTTLKVGDKAVKIRVPQNIADGKWNQITLSVTSTTIELSVNEHVEFARNPQAAQIQLGELSYLGGLEMNKKFKATQKGCGTACDHSFKGCIRNIHLMDVKRGLPDAQSSNNLLPGCVWNYPCQRNPCQSEAFCVQKGLDSFQCKCPANNIIDTSSSSSSSCIEETYNNNERYSVFSRSASLATELELLSVEPLEVLEGGSEIISTLNLHLVLDYKKYGIKDSGVQFTVEQTPEHGMVTLDGWPQKQTFSLLDVARDKIHYVHDGSEESRDNVQLSIGFSTSDTFTLPVYLQGTFRFNVIVNVVPKNDPPIFESPETARVLRVVQGAKKIITNDLLKSYDPDNNQSELVYKILHSEVGYFEHFRKVGAKVESFTQDDIDKKKIIFVHTAKNAADSWITLEISDGRELSPVYKLRVSVTPQLWRLDRNTGLQLLHQTAQIISPFNLSYTSNVPNSDFNVLFKIVKKPTYGDIEVDRSPNIWEPVNNNIANKWESTDVFSSTDLKQHKVRYQHNRFGGDPLFDEFEFRTALNKTQLYTFRITFVECKLQQIYSKTLELNSVWELPLTRKSLLFETKPTTKSSSSIVYQILKYPQYGYLFSSVSKYRLKCFDNFTQDDILSENVRYRLYQKAFSDVTDLIHLSVKSPGCGNSSANIQIKYYPSNEDKFRVQVNIKQLDVEEGMSGSIDRAHLYINANFVTDLIFNVTTAPKNGMIQARIQAGKIRNYTRYFTVQELYQNQIFYVHDGSETEQDQFQFMALSNTDETFQYVGQFFINIHLKNDHSPLRVVDKIFRVVVGGEKLLTDKDLKYIDLDIGTPSNGIIYTLREIPNGQFFNINSSATTNNNNNNRKNITEFTQQDLDNKLILFKHRGPEFGKIRLWVTDGQFHVTGMLEIHASGPFIDIEINKKIIVQSGKSVRLTQEHLYYSTNLYTASDADVIYEINGGLTFGKLITTDDTTTTTNNNNNNNNNKVLKHFTQQDINLGLISYYNDIVSGNVDEVNLKLHCKDAINLAQITILILPASYWEPLQLRRIKKLHCEESTSALITQDNLEIIQTNVPTTIITYYINQRPQYGYLTILLSSSSSSSSEDSKTTNNESESEILNVAQFSQNLLNDKRILYIQSGRNQSKDSITFNVTNGLVWLNNVRLEIIIIPENWYLGTNDVSVNEGDSIKLTPINLYIETEYYRSMNVIFKISENFRYGCIQIYGQCIRNNNGIFSSNNLTDGTVAYLHNGDENRNDYATFYAQIGDKKSELINLTVNIMPINDHAPQLINNTGLEMWEGGTAVITNSMLAATDEDRPKETLKFYVQSCWCGNVSLITDGTNNNNNNNNNTNKSALNYFTQQFIDNGLVIFRHNNGTGGKFGFNISDGLYTTKVYFFEIKTRKIEMKIVNNKTLKIFPLQKKIITRENLLTKISDNRTIWYEIEKPPSLGRLMMKSDTLEYNSVVNKFTQQDLDEETIYYEHLHPFLDLYANDSFIFNVNAYLAGTIQHEIFSIDISVSSGGLDRYVQIPKILVDEGGITNLQLNLSQVVKFLDIHASIRSPIIHVNVETPKHGHVFLQNDKDNSLMTFTQQQIENGQVLYEHDNSDTLNDSVKLTLYLMPGYIMLCNISVRIEVNPVNDQPFKLVTPAPTFSVVQGENHTITKLELCTEDADTEPKDLKYDLVNGPSSGKLLLLPNLDPVNHFTQADIDQNRLIYVHQSAVLKDSFHLRIWDEKFKPEFTFFNIHVIPVNLTIRSGLEVQIKQGDNVVILNERMIHVETNTDPNKIFYTIVRKPRNGVLFNGKSETDRFTHQDLCRNQIMYMQIDTTTSNDSFRLTGEIIVGNNISFKHDVQVFVEVKPFMQMHQLTVHAGKITKLLIKNLDASALAKLTGCNPKYTIISAPAFCQLRKIIRSSGEKRNIFDSVIRNFTHEEILAGLIHLDVKADMAVPDQGLIDKIQFILNATIFQPALGELRIKILPEIIQNINNNNNNNNNNNEISIIIPEPNEPAGHESDVLLTASTMKNDYIRIGMYVLVTIVLAIAITTIVVIFLLRCRTWMGNGNSDRKNDHLALGPLPRPPDRLLASPVKSMNLVPPQVAPPQCKITPLNGTTTTTTTEFDSPSPYSGGYPYGGGGGLGMNEEIIPGGDGDWSSVDNNSQTDPASKSIMLRRNQYWV